MVEWKKLGEVCEYFRGRSLSKTDIGLGEAKVILYGELYTIYGDYITSVKSKTSTEKAKAATSIQTNDLLLPVSSTTKEAQIGKASVYLGNDNVSLGSDAIILRNAANSAYLMYYLNSLLFEKEKMSCVHGTTIMHLSPKELVDKKIPIPSLSEQTRIVGILDTFTSAINNLKEQIAQRRKQYEYYRDQLLDLEGKPGVEMKTLGEVVSKECSLSYGIVQPGDDVPNGIPVVRPIDLVSMFVEKEGLKKTTKEISDSYKRTILKGNEILFCVRGTTGVMSLASEMLKDCNVTRGIVPITIDDKITKMFVYYQLKGLRLQKTIAEKTNGTALRQINVKDLRLLSLMLPPLSEQQRIVSILDTFEASIQNLEAQLKERQKQYEYYRNKLLTFE